MNLDELRKETYYHYSKTAATIARQLALVGIAAVWIFRIEQKDGSIEVPQLLVGSLMLLASGVAFDFLRYVWQTGFWGYYCWRQEHKGKEEIDYHPQWVNWPPLVLLWFCFLSVIAGYTFLIIYLFCALQVC